MAGAVVFDVGECLVDETREYGTWADWLGVPRHVFSAVFGAVIARGQDYRETFQVLRPGFDLDKARQLRADDGKPEWFGEGDLYSDVRPALARLRDEELWVGIAGNQTARADSLSKLVQREIRSTDQKRGSGLGDRIGHAGGHGGKDEDRGEAQ